MSGQTPNPMAPRRDGADTLDVDLGADKEAPPAYGAHLDQLQLSQAGFEAGATVTSDGRVDINIHQTSGRFRDLLAPALRSQVFPREKASDLPPSYVPPSLGGQPGQVPPPRLNVVVQIVGSRGDVQPFVALGKTLKDTYGHRVRIATHATFQSFVEENGLEFFSIGGDPAELMAFMVKHPGLMPGFDALKEGEVSKRRKGIEEILIGCWRSCVEAGDGSGPAPPTHRPNEPLDDRYAFSGGPHRPFVADVIIANPPSFAHIHLAEKLGIPLHMMFTMPWTPTKAFPHPLANIQSTNTDEVMTNYVSYALVEMMTWQGLGDVINRFRASVLDLDPLSLIWAPGLLARLQIPTTYCWSPALIPKPNDWNHKVSIAGFYFLNLASSYTPDPGLAAFLAAGPPPVYIGFGSIVVDDPNALTRMIFDAVSKTGVRALVSKGWGGIGAESVGIPDGVFMLGNCPHDWLFQHVSCVVHHGGAGTTAAGIKLGKPTVVVPFFGDQPFWGSMIARAGAGPEPVPYKQLTADTLAAAIQEALKPTTLTRAEELGAKIREEQGTDLGGKSFHDFLDTDGLRCSLVPSRVAVWRVRRSQIKLSALAAAVLLREGVISQPDLKLYRPKEYITDGQPWDPISAVTAALLGDVGSIAMAVADLPRELFRSAKKATSGIATPSTPGNSKTQSSRSGSLADVASATATSDASSAVSVPTPTTTTGTADAQSEKQPISKASSGLSAVASAQGSTTSLPKTAESPSQNQPLSPRVTLSTAMDTSKGVARIVETGMKTPMNFCMGLARGFRNTPLLYNDETVRPQERVTDLSSGLKIAGKEFGFGLYDGISGLIMQPLKGAQKEGAVGAVKGFGKGIGGLILKPAAGAWSIPAYAMQGVNAEFRNRFSKSWQNYIITSRLAQGKEDLERSSRQEQDDITLRWMSKESDLKGFYQLKNKSKESQEGYRSPPVSPLPSPGPSTATRSFGQSFAAPSLAAAAAGPSTAAGGGPPSSREAPKTGFRHTWNLSFGQRKQLHAERDAWTAKQTGAGAGGVPVPEVAHSDEMERAIRESVQQTSKGNAEEDAQIEQAIRASVDELRLRAAAADDSRNYGSKEMPSSAAASSPPTYDITDEEYQALIEEAVKQSLQAPASFDPDHKFPAPSANVGGGDDEEGLRRALKESLAVGESRPNEGGDESFRRALQESESAHQEKQRMEAAAMNEEEVVLAYVKRQSLAEEEFRRLKAKGKRTEGAEDEQDEDLRRAMEESLKSSPGRAGGPA
ncbi:hypothetical protein GGTG_08281 [Gaeumannomyces tritici R3-111a-1]|uniref:Uncharacterized protein n=1 Tax=Gaeumannomyces tritici (strain R3-111a-1) TaxID=644352 RepID=J3P445_GAET3|nr:hypothetical protein GGTG_08281 [Gaeumannomyces tritici R3-111a-1]EJT74441.1 hypothetical protein GGTG_08281 [Gaeumannomyces tritici R3-111a-1]